MLILIVFFNFFNEEGICFYNVVDKNMGDVDEYRCFVGSFLWFIIDRGLKEVFEKFGGFVEVKVILIFYFSVIYMVVFC